jgi:hypothetical protein
MLVKVGWLHKSFLDFQRAFSIAMGFKPIAMMITVLHVDSPDFASLAHPLFTFGVKRDGKNKLKIPLCACAERVTSAAKSGESNMKAIVFLST